MCPKSKDWIMGHEGGDTRAKTIYKNQTKALATEICCAVVPGLGTKKSHFVAVQGYRQKKIKSNNFMAKSIGGGSMY